MNVQDGSGNTPLHVTVEEDAFDAMNYLLSMYVEHAYLILENYLVLNCIVHVSECVPFTAALVRTF